MSWSDWARAFKTEPAGREIEVRVIPAQTRPEKRMARINFPHGMEWSRCTVGDWRRVLATLEQANVPDYARVEAGDAFSAFVEWEVRG